MRSEEEKVRTLVAEQAAEWHVAHSDGPLSPQQARAFMHWLRTSPVHVAEYMTIAGIARDAADVARVSTASLEDLLAEEENTVRLLHQDADEVHARTTAPASPHAYRVRSGRGGSSRRPRRRPMRRLAAVAATLAVIAVAAWAGLYGLAPAPHIASFATRHGEDRSLQLPDSTLVRLDSDSAIVVRYDKHRRRVTVERGQAYFKVANDPARPFSVRAGQSLIRDIGTAFDVYRHRDGTTITVAEGRVQVWDEPPTTESTAARWLPWAKRTGLPRGQPLVTLDAGERALLNTSGRMISHGPADLEQALAWTQGKIVFDSRPVASVAAEFNRYNNTQISIEDSRVAALPISGTFNAHDVATFVAFLDTLPEVHVQRHDQHIYVYSNHGKQRHRR